MNSDSSGWQVTLGEGQQGARLSDVVAQAAVAQTSERPKAAVTTMTDWEAVKESIDSLAASVDEAMTPSVEADVTKPHTEAMTEMNREEVKARLEAAEARVQSMAEGMRADNDRLRSSFESSANKIDAAGSVAQAEMNAFRQEMLRSSSETLASVANEVHTMKAWVLSGALSALLAIFGLVLSAVLKQPAAPNMPAQQAPVVVQIPGYALQPMPAASVQKPPLHP
jgi:hypothetical protein